MKYEKHAPRVQGSDSREGELHGRDRHAARQNSSVSGTNDSYPIMPYPAAVTSGWQQDYYSQSTPAPVVTGPSISAMLNPGDYSEYTTGYSTVSDRSASLSKMTLQSALSPVSTAPTDKSFASVVLSEQRSAASSNDAYTYRARDPQMAYTTYASSEDLKQEKLSLEYNYYYADGQAQHPGSSAGRRTSGSSKSSKYEAVGHASEQPREVKPKMKSSKGRKTSERHNYTPSSTAISSPAFSVPNTPSRQTPRLASIGTGSFGSSDNEDDEDDEGYLLESVERTGASRDTSAAPLGRPRGEVKKEPAVQRERNRVAATKCRAKSKAAISKLEEDERIVSDRRDSLSAEKSALMKEVLNLRMELLKHGHCHTDGNIQNYLRNAARMIGNSGGSNPIWGPDGSGKNWTGGQKDGGRHSRS